MKYFHLQNQTCTTLDESNDLCTQDAASLPSSGTGSSVGLTLDDPENYALEDEARFGHVMPCSGPDGDEIEECEDSVYTYEAADKKGTSLFGREQNLRLQENTLASSLGSGAGLGSKLTQSKKDILRPGSKSEKKKRKVEKGTSSILRFFHNQDSRSFPDLKAFRESRESTSEGKPVQEKTQQPMSGITPSICNSISDAWSLKIDEIDPSVLSELPPEVQAEVRAWIQPQKRANIVKRGSSIVQYFSPTPNS